MGASLILVGRRYDWFSVMLQGGGHRVLNLELIRTVPIEDLSDLDNRFEKMDEYDGVFITSPAAADVLLGQIAATGQPFKTKIYVLGHRSRTMLEDAGLETVSLDGANTAEEFIGGFDKGHFVGRTYLFIRGDKSLRTIPELLEGSANVDEVVVYRTVDVAPDHHSLETVKAQLQNSEIDWICLFSPSGVASILKQIDFGLVKQVPLAAIGRTTELAATEAGLRVAFVAEKARADEFAESFVRHLKHFD